MRKHPYPLIIAVLLVFFVFFLIAIDVGTLVNAYQNKDYCYLSVGTGSSMEPVIHNGDMLVILYDHSPSFALDVGDILVYWYSTDMAVGHRIIDIREDKYYVQGDNNPNRDNICVSSDAVVGKIIGIIDNSNIIGKLVVDLYI